MTQYLNTITKVYGCSDDLVVVEQNNAFVKEIDCYERDVFITFKDGTKIRIGYSKPNMAVWYVLLENKGAAASKLTVCEDEDADVYSDIFEINSEIDKYEIIKS